MTKVMVKSGYHHGDLRQQLIAATRALVEAKGRDGFSVSEACRAAGVSTAAPYKHFEDRIAMLRAVTLEGFAELAARFEAAVENKHPGSVAAIAALGTEYVRFAEENPGIFRMMFAAQDGTAETEAAGLACYGCLLRQIAARLSCDVETPEVLTAAFPLWSFVHGLSFLRVDGKAEIAKVGQPLPVLIEDATRRLLGAGHLESGAPSPNHVA